MKTHISHYLKIATMSFSLLFPQGGFSSDVADEYLEVGNERVPIASFVATIFSDAFKGKRLLVLASLGKHGKTDILYKSPAFQDALKDMEEGKRNAFIHSLPFEDKTMIKSKMHWSLLGSLGEFETGKAKEKVCDLRDALPSTNVEGVISVISDPRLRAFFGFLCGVDDTPPSKDAPFLERYFYEQRGEVKVLTEELALQSDCLKNAKKGSEEFYKIAATLDFLGKRLYAANNPTDFNLKNFPDGLLFGFSRELAHLELTHYFLGTVANREHKKIVHLAAQFDGAEGERERQKRLAILLNVTLLKREIVASSAVALGQFLATEKKDDQALLDTYMTLGNFFHEYIAAAKDLGEPHKRLPEFHATLCQLTSSLGFAPCALLDMDSLTKGIKEEREEGSSNDKAVSALPHPSSTPHYQRDLKKLQDAEHALGEQAISQHSAQDAKRAGLVSQASFIAAEVQKASKAGDLKKANELIKFLQKIKAELSELSKEF